MSVPPGDGVSDLAALFAEDEPPRVRGMLDPRASGRARRRRRGGLVAFLIVLGVVLLAAAYVTAALLAPLPAGALEVREPAVAPGAAASIAMPGEGESAVSIVGAGAFPGTQGTDGILAASGGTAERPIASISKLITALVVLDAKPLASASDPGPTITFGADAAALYETYYRLDCLVQPMRAGSTMSERDAIETTLVVSACNYADALALWAFGSEDRFVAATRAWLASHHLDHTRMVEPTGIDDRNESTPADLLQVGALAADDPALASIVSMPHLDVPGLPPTPNTNGLLGTDGVDGIKTGTLDTAGADLLFSARLDVGASAPVRVVGVELGGTDHPSVDADVRAMLASIRAAFHVVPLVRRGQVLGRYTTPWGHAAVTAAADASVLTWSDTPVTARVATTRVREATRGTEVGHVSFRAGSAASSVPLRLASSVRPPDSWWRITHPGQLLDAATGRAGR